MKWILAIMKANYLTTSTYLNTILQAGPKPRDLKYPKNRATLIFIGSCTTTFYYISFVD